MRPSTWLAVLAFGMDQFVVAIEDAARVLRRSGI
jgi:hypothetical protein